MFKQSDILDEKKSKLLREKSKKITFPLSEDDKLLINDIPSLTLCNKKSSPGIDLSGFFIILYLRTIFVL